MPLINLLEELHLDRDVILRDRDISRDLARAFERDSDGLNSRLAAATEHRRAAAHSVLLSDRDQAVHSFANAGRLYCAAGNAYGLMMFTCGGVSPSDLRAVASEFKLFDRESPERLQTIHLLVAAAAGGWDRSMDINPEAVVAGSLGSPIGTLGMTVGQSLELAKALSNSRSRADSRNLPSKLVAINQEKASREDPSETLSAALLPFVTAHSEAMRRAMRNSYHWQRMLLPFHPAEPDILAAVYSVEVVAREIRLNGALQLLQSVPLPFFTREFLRLAVADRFGDESQELSH